MLFRSVLACAERGIPVIAVDNPCLLEVGAEALGLEVLPAASYSEAAGLMLALREGIAREGRCVVVVRWSRHGLLKKQKARVPVGRRAFETTSNGDCQPAASGLRKPEIGRKRGRAHLRRGGECHAQRSGGVKHGDDQD